MKLNTFVISIILLIAVVLANAVFCDGKEIPLSFAWDANSTSGQWDSIKIFVRFNNDQYDYNTPLAEIPQRYENGLSVPTKADINFNFPDNEKITAYFVARSYDANSHVSTDSNEVSRVVDLIPLEAFVVSAEYNESNSSIDFFWSITDVRALRYRIYKSNEENGTYYPFARVDYEEGKTNYSESISIDELFPINEKTTVYLKVIAWGNDKISSPDSNIIPITIDRRENVDVDSVINFRLILE